MTRQNKKGAVRVAGRRAGSRAWPDADAEAGRETGVYVGLEFVTAGLWRTTVQPTDGSSFGERWIRIVKQLFVIELGPREESEA